MKENTIIMNRQWVVAEHVVDRYLRKELATDLNEAFEQFYLTCPETLQELELTRALMARENWPAVTKATGASVETSGWLARLGGWLATPKLGPALAGGFAILLLAPILTTLSMSLGGSDDPSSDSSALAAANFRMLSLPKVRGSRADFQAVGRSDLPDTDSMLVLSLALDYASCQSHRVRIERWPDSEIVTTIPNVIEQASGDALLSLPAKLLSPGNYRAVVMGCDASNPDTPVATFDFTLA